MKPRSPDDIAEMRARGYDTSTIADAEQQSKRWEAAQQVCRTIESTYGLGIVPPLAQKNSSQPQPERESYGGMTVNERLFVAGTFEHFHAAARHRDRSAMIALLLAVELDEQQAAHTTDAILNNPTKYGY